jgi:hypothetical protein
VIGNSGWACVCAGMVNVVAGSKTAKRKARTAKEISPNLLTGWKEFGDIPDFQKLMYSICSLHANSHRANFRAEVFPKTAKTQRIHGPKLSIVTL